MCKAHFKDGDYFQQTVYVSVRPNKVIYVFMNEMMLIFLPPMDDYQLYMNRQRGQAREDQGSGAGVSQAGRRSGEPEDDRAAPNSGSRGGSARARGKLVLRLFFRHHGQVARHGHHVHRQGDTLKSTANI